MKIQSIILASSIAAVMSCSASAYYIDKTQMFKCPDSDVIKHEIVRNVLPSLKFNDSSPLNIILDSSQVETKGNFRAGEAFYAVATTLQRTPPYFFQIAPKKIFSATTKIAYFKHKQSIAYCDYKTDIPAFDIILSLNASKYNKYGLLKNNWISVSPPR